MSDSLSYADRARKAISPSNLAVKALSIVAHHSNPQTIDDWPQVGSQRKADSPKKPSPDPHIAKSNSLAFIVSKSISSPARLQPSHPQNKSSSAPMHDLPTTNQKVIFGSIGLETPPPLSPTPALVLPELPTKTPTFSVGLDDSTEPVPARLKSRTRPSGRLDAEEPESSKINDVAAPTSATTQPPNKWKFGTTTSTPVVNGNGKKPLPPDDSSSSSLLFQQPDPDSNHPKRRERAISFGYINSLLPLDENVSAPTKTKSKSKNKTKTKVIPKTKLSPQVEVANQIDDVDPNPPSNSIPDSNREDRGAESDPDFKVRDFGFGFGSAQVGLGGDEGQVDDESGDKQSVTLTTGGQIQQSPQLTAGPVIIDHTPPSITPPQQHGPPPHSQPHGPIPRSSRRGNTFGNVSRAGGYGSHIHSHERGGYGPGYERGGRGGMNGYSRGYPSGRGYNRGGGGGGGGGPGPASSHSSPSSGGGGQRAPYDNATSPSLPPLHYSQLPHLNQQQQHGMDSIYYPPPRHISGAGPPPGPFDPYQPYPQLHQQHSHLPPLPPHYQGYPHFQQVPPPLPPHLLASVSSTSSISNMSTSATSSPAAGGDGGVPSISTTSSTSTSTSTSPLPRNVSSSSSTSPRSSSTPPSSHTSPPVPIPLTILPFPLDSIRYYLLGQLEYYLSPQNLVQDFFLRTQMDSKGYIPISLLASFNRIKQLTLDTRLVKEVLMLSAFVEVNGGMVRMGGVGAASSSSSSSSVGKSGESQNHQSSSWESFVLPDAVESVVVEDVVENVDNNSNGGGYGYHHQHHQQQLNGYGYGGGSGGYGYGYGAAGYGYGYGYGYPPPVGPAGLGYYEDPQSQQQHQSQHQQGEGGASVGGYEPGEGVDNTPSHDHGETTVPSMMNGHSTAGGVCESTTKANTRKLDGDDRHTAPHPHTSVLLSNKKEEINKPNGIFKHEQQQHGDEGEEYDDGEEEEEEEEEDVVFVMGGTDVSTSWTPERERRA